MDDFNSDSDWSDEAATTNPLEHVVPEILNQLNHLDLSSLILFKERNFIGGGGYGDVFKGRCNFPGRGKVKVAIKRLRFYLKEDIKALFEKEIYVWSKLHHENVLPLLGFAFANEYRYPLLISEWMDRGSAWSYVRAHLQCDILRLVTGFARGLAYLHDQGVVHADIKSDNVLVSNDGDALLCDFGCARMMSASRSLVNPTSGIRGTSRYLACELLEISHQASGHTKQSDVWAFGMAIFELLTRKRPYAELTDSQAMAAIIRHEMPTLPAESDYRAERRPDGSQDLWEICVKCWRHKPEGRPDMYTILRQLELKRPSRRHDQKGVNNNDSTTGAPADPGNLRPDDKLGREPGSLSSGHHPIPGIRQPIYQPPILGSILETTNLDEVHPRIKREDSWSATFNSSCEEMLDVFLDRDLKHESPVKYVRFSADGKFLATCCRRVIRIYDTQSWGRVCSLYDGSLDSSNGLYIQSLSFSPDSRFLAFEAAGNSIKVREIMTRRTKRMLQGHRGKIHSIEYSPDGKLIISGSSDCTVRLWDPNSGVKKILRSRDPSEVPAEMKCVAISPDGQLVTSGSSDSVVRIWEVQSGNLVERLRGHRESVTCVSFSPDGRALLTGSCDKTVKEWDISSLSTDKGRRLPLPPVTKSTIFASGSNTVVKQQRKRELPVPPSAVPPPGAIIGSNLKDELARQVGDRGSVNVLTFTGHNDHVFNVAMSADKRWIVSVSRDHIVYFVERLTRIVAVKLHCSNDPVLSSDFRATSGLFVTGCVDMHARIWRYQMA